PARLIHPLRGYPGPSPRVERFLEGRSEALVMEESMKRVHGFYLWILALVAAFSFTGRPAAASKAGHAVRATGHKMAKGYHKMVRNYHYSRARANMRRGHRRKARMHMAKAASEQHKAAKNAKESH